MDITKYEAVAQACSDKSDYFKKIDFQNLAAAFHEASVTIKEMAELLRKVAETPVEEGANE